MEQMGLFHQTEFLLKFDFDSAVPMMHAITEIVDEEPVAIITTWAVLHRHNYADMVIQYMPRHLFRH